MDDKILKDIEKITQEALKGLDKARKEGNPEQAEGFLKVLDAIRERVPHAEAGRQLLRATGKSEKVDKIRVPGYGERLTTNEEIARIPGSTEKISTREELTRVPGTARKIDTTSEAGRVKGVTEHLKPNEEIARFKKDVDIPFAKKIAGVTEHIDTKQVQKVGKPSVTNFGPEIERLVKDRAAKLAAAKLAQEAAEKGIIGGAKKLAKTVAKNAKKGVKALPFIGGALQAAMSNDVTAGVPILEEAGDIGPEKDSLDYKIETNQKLTPAEQNMKRLRPLLTQLENRQRMEEEEKKKNKKK